MSHQISNSIVQAYAGSNSHQYVCEDQKGNLVLSSKKSTAGNTRLQFNEILTKVENESSSITENQRKLVAASLKTMADRKFTNAYTGKSCVQKVIGAVCEFFSKLRNLFFGYGFQTHCGRAKQLAKRLENWPAGAVGSSSVSLQVKTKEGKNKVAQSDSEADVAAFADHPFVNRTYTAVSESQQKYPIGIQLSAEEIQGPYASIYQGKLDEDAISAIGGRFTYFDARMKDIPIPAGKEAYFNDNGWGCAWRSTLNQINQLTAVLESTHHILPKDDYRREIGMHDIQALTGWKTHTWLEPHVAVELFLRFVEVAYEETDQKRVLELFEPKGFLFLSNEGAKKLSYKDWIKAAVQREVAREKNKVEDAANFRMSKLVTYFWNKSGQDITNVLLNNSDDSVLTAHLITFNDLFSDYAAKPVERIAAWFAYLALVKLYPENDCQPTTSLDVSKFPQLNEETHPIPLMIDDAITARNIYGFHVQSNQVQDLFIGEPHVGFGAYPKNLWVACGWKNAQSIFTKQNQIMMVGILPRAPEEI
jgi:hypothetical protein